MSIEINKVYYWNNAPENTYYEDVYILSNKVKEFKSSYPNATIEEVTNIDELNDITDWFRINSIIEVNGKQYKYKMPWYEEIRKDDLQ